MYMGGFSENVLDFYKIKKLNCLLIEDACHALGAEYNYKNKLIKIGSCRHQIFQLFSTSIKTNYTGEGGIVTTNNDRLAKKKNFRLMEL